MPDRLIALLRTVVPSLWAYLLAWLVARGAITTEAATGAAPLGAQLVDFLIAPAVVGVYYLVARWLESQPWMPRWLVRLLLGSARPPTYTPTTRDW